VQFVNATYIRQYTTVDAPRNIRNAGAPLETGFASRPACFDVVCMTVINSLVDVAKGIQLIVRRPLITPHSATWQNVSLYNGSECGCIALRH